MEALPHDVWIGVGRGLTLRDVASCVAVCRHLRAESDDNELWLHVFSSSCWPPSRTLLAFAEGRAEQIDWRARLRARMDAPATIVVDIGRGYTKWGVVHGFHGRSEGEVLRPQFVQLSSSATSPPDCSVTEQLRYIELRLDRLLIRALLDAAHPLRPVATGRTHGLATPTSSEKMLNRIVCLRRGFITEHALDLGGRFAMLDAYDGENASWTLKLVSLDAHHGMVKLHEPQLAFAAESADFTLVPRACELPMLLGEPFLETARRGCQETGAQVGTSSWACSQRQQLGTNRAAPVQVVEQARMSLWAHGIDHGIVINIGQRASVAIPVVNGRVVAKMARPSTICSVDLTQAMLMSASVNSREDLLTWSRDIKEQHCYVAPPSPHTRGVSLADRLSAGDEYGVEPVTVRTPLGDEVSLGREIVLVPELLFTTGNGYLTLPELLAFSVEECLRAEECNVREAQDMLRQIVIVGGAAEFPGLRPRLEFEVRELLRLKDCPYPRLRAAFASSGDVFVLNPPRGPEGAALASPRYATFVGGCVRAASSFPLSEMAALTPTFPQVSPVRESIRGDIFARLFSAMGPGALRAGGGGGFEDQLWLRFRDAYEAESESDGDDAGDHQGSWEEEEEEEEDEQSARR